MKMKMKLNAVMLVLLAVLLSDCSDRELQPSWTDEAGAEQSGIRFDILLPLAELPAARSIENDSDIRDYTVWVFEQGVFREAVGVDDKYTDAAGSLRRRITYDKTNGGTMEIVLNKTWTAVRLMMIANVSVSPPDSTVKWEDAEEILREATFTYTGDEDGMPMYGTSGEAAFPVKQGMQGVIQLKRCMAKIVVDAKDARDHFRLDSIAVYHVDTKGTVAPVVPLNRPGVSGARIKGRVENQIGTVYIPEISDTVIRPMIVVQGLYFFPDSSTSVTRFYKLGFIQRVSHAGSVVSYEKIDSVKRNYCYRLKIEYLVAGAGKDSLEIALREPASNAVGEATVSVDIMDEDIMDITTDNYIYLGVTSGRVNAVLNTDTNYYVARINVVTNNPLGWEMEALPVGVWTTVSRFVPDPSAPVISAQPVWVYFKRDIYQQASEVTVYIYSGNIRKSIVVVFASSG